MQEYITKNSSGLPLAAAGFGIIPLPDFCHSISIAALGRKYAFLAPDDKNCIFIVKKGKNRGTRLPKLQQAHQ